MRRKGKKLSLLLVGKTSEMQRRKFRSHSLAETVIMIQMTMLWTCRCLIVCEIVA